MHTSPMRASRVVALGLAVGAFFVLQEALTDLAGGKPINVANDVDVVLLLSVSWAVLTPLVLLALRRWPLDAKPGFRVVLVHALVATALAAGQSVIRGGVRMVMRVVGTPVGWGEAARQSFSLVAFTWGVFTGICLYAAVVMVYTVTRLRDLYVAEKVSAAALQAELNQTKLDTLRSQLRPHFLFNTLNAISVFVTEDAAKAQQMILRLSTLLRRSLDEEAHEVSLRQELAFVNDYLDIQRGRFGDRLTVELAIEPGALEARVPAFLLQPLLENAIEHGKADDRRTTIALAAVVDGHTLRITLTDDGPGPVANGPMREGIGLANTRARLQHLYGARGAVALRPANGDAGAPGARVEILMPFREAPA
jgi:hypothetical protein